MIDMVKNASYIPAVTFADIFEAAGEAVGASTDTVELKVGLARRSSSVYGDAQASLAENRQEVHIVLPLHEMEWKKGGRRNTVDSTSHGKALMVYSLCAHEMSHVRDFQEGVFDGDDKSNGLRRAKWGLRPQEIRAEDRADAALANMSEKAESAVRALAIEIERW